MKFVDNIQIVGVIKNSGRVLIRHLEQIVIVVLDRYFNPNRS